MVEWKHYHKSDNYVMALNGEDVVTVTEHYYLGDSLKPKDAKYFYSYRLCQTVVTCEPLASQTLEEAKAEALGLYKIAATRYLGIYQAQVDYLKNHVEAMK